MLAKFHGKISMFNRDNQQMLASPNAIIELALSYLDD